MRNWLSEVRIGLIAGVSAGVVILAAPHVARVAQLGLARSSVASDRWTPPLVDPIQAASAALARGDSAFVAIAVGDTLRFPGLTESVSEGATRERIRLFSPASTGVRGAGWGAFVARAMPYAAAYNAVVQVARVSATSRS